jgi:hypothetical protein
MGGVGTPAHEVLNYVPSFFMGIPTLWVKQRDVECYNGRTRDIHGNPIEKWKGGYYKEGDFKGVAVDPYDRPVFESQAAYLERHGLFVAGEKKRLRKADYEPARLEKEYY